MKISDSRRYNLEQLVSIIMPAFNAETTIKTSIDSVLKQTYSNWELIIINDASGDKTGLIVNEYLNTENRITIINLEKNGGLPNARNQGVKRAKGEFIAFLDSDDIWSPDKLLKQTNFHLKHPEIKISHTGFEMFNESGVVKRPLKKLVDFNYKKDGDMLPSIYCKNTVGVLTVMIKKDLFISVGGFDTSLWTMEDQDLWIRIAKLRERFGCLPENLAYYRLNPTGISHNTAKYKKAYKKLIDKYKSETSANNSYNLVLANYYRYFGTVYFKKKAYKISLLYFMKSLKHERYVLNMILTVPFVCMALVKYITVE
jgi:teichuronic acid biosynthesis glycosyltransferase TuaG